MGLFDIFKRKPKLVDPIFGELTYTTFKDGLKNFYDGEVMFHSQKAGIGVDADERGPTNEQHAFYKKVEEQYPLLVKNTIIPFLEKELEGWRNSDKITDFDNEFEIDGISLPRISNKPVQWSICYFSKKIDHYITIEFIDFNPQPNPVIDG